MRELLYMYDRVLLGLTSRDSRAVKKKMQGCEFTLLLPLYRPQEKLAKQDG